MRDNSSISPRSPVTRTNSTRMMIEGNLMEGDMNVRQVHSRHTCQRKICGSVEEPDKHSRGMSNRSGQDHVVSKINAEREGAKRHEAQS